MDRFDSAHRAQQFHRRAGVGRYDRSNLLHSDVLDLFFPSFRRIPWADRQFFPCGVGCCDVNDDLYYRIGAGWCVLPGLRLDYSDRVWTIYSTGMVLFYSGSLTGDPFYTDSSPVAVSINPAFPRPVCLGDGAGVAHGVLSTASSSATLPLTMACGERRAGVHKRISSFVLPLGATVNMDGTALYECVAVIFIAQAVGHDLSAIDQVTIIFTALLVSVGAAGIPHAGLVMMVIIFNAVGLPLKATGMIFAVDRVLDMARTMTNVWSDSTCMIVAAHFEDEIDRDVFNGENVDVEMG